MQYFLCKCVVVIRHEKSQDMIHSKLSAIKTCANVKFYCEFHWIVHSASHKTKAKTVSTVLDVVDRIHGIKTLKRQIETKWGDHRFTIE